MTKYEPVAGTHPSLRAAYLATANASDARLQRYVCLLIDSSGITVSHVCRTTLLLNFACTEVVASAKNKKRSVSLATYVLQVRRQRLCGSMRNG